MNWKRWSTLGAALLVAACSAPIKKPIDSGEVQPRYLRTSFSQLPEWQTRDLRSAWSSWQSSCKALAKRSGWENVCRASTQVNAQDNAAIRQYFENYFQAYQLSDGNKDSGLITGYYEPLLKGNLKPDAQAKHPLYPSPNDMLSVELNQVYARLAGMRLRGRLEGNRVVPYYTAAEIVSGKGPQPASAIAWVNDPVELMFLQIQGSGRIELPDGKLIRVGYADQNGHPYQSLGRWLIDQGELKAHQASMQGIKAWAQANPKRINELWAANPSYVFFRRLPNADGGPPGALGVPLTPQASVAVDARYIRLGTPLWLSTTRPLSDVPMVNMVHAQDTGGAIKGVVRADYFWGFGESAGAEAGRMKQRGKMWAMLPKGMNPPDGVRVE